MSRPKKGRIGIHVAVAIILVIALTGATLAVIHASSTGLVLFELIAFSVGIAALLLAVLGSVSASYQMRMVQRISREVHAAINELKDIDKTNEAIHRRINQDYELAKDIAEALHEAGVIDDETGRRVVTRNIEHKIRSRTGSTHTK